jgi:Protein of unknown function (DUF3768)
MTDRTARIRALNDQLRATGQGGRLVVTAGIAALPAPIVAAVFIAVQTFDRFTPDNDPHEEHDFALITVAGQRIMFKIDYYDASMSGLSPDPTDPAVTRRVLTILLASEY